MTSLEFYDIKDLAVKHFYHMEDGEDFDWIRKEWNNFHPLLTTRDQVEGFILSMGYLFDTFCKEAYFSKSDYFSPPQSIETYIEETYNDDPFNDKLEESLNRIFNKTLDILLEVYWNPFEVYREISSISIHMYFPHSDGKRFIDSLLMEKFKIKCPGWDDD